jgi:ABC-type nitrate/sulfonate/bicarbonate transport system permease component
MLWAAIESTLSPLALLILWDGGVRSALIDPAFLPAPSQIARAFVSIGPSVLLAELWASLFRVITGLLFGCAAGVFLGVWMALNKHVDRFFAPILAATYAVPKSAFIPLLILWFGVGNVSTIVVIFIASLLPVVIYTFHGVHEVPRVLRWSAQSFGVSRWEILRSILVPAASAQILTGIRIALGFAFVLAVSAEMIASTSGLGKLIFQYGQGGNYDAMFAALMVLVAAAFIADQAFTRYRDYYLRWMPNDRARGAGG